MLKFREATDTFKELTIIYLSVILLSASLFSYFEGKGIWDSIWWAFVTGLSIGYGDIYPVTDMGKVVGILLGHVVLLFIIPLIVTRLVERMIDNKHQFTDEEQNKLFKDVVKIKNHIRGARFGQLEPMQEDINKIKSRVHINE